MHVIKNFKDFVPFMVKKNWRIHAHPCHIPPDSLCEKHFNISIFTWMCCAFMSYGRLAYINLHHELQIYLDNKKTLEIVSVTIYFAMFDDLFHWSLELEL